MLAAWNGGPGNLKKWMKKVEYNNDPLLFIESIPSKETRIFVERVLTNYWIYQARFDNPTPSLDLLAQGKWPSYQSEGGVNFEVAEEGQK
jgi:soluble lytic murein transglycosylase-like protein